MFKDFSHGYIKLALEYLYEEIQNSGVLGNKTNNNTARQEKNKKYLFILKLY